MDPVTLAAARAYTDERTSVITLNAHAVYAGGTLGFYQRWPGTSVTAGNGEASGLAALFHIPAHWTSWDLEVLWTNPQASTGNAEFQIALGSGNTNVMPLIGFVTDAQEGQYVPVNTMLAAGRTETGPVVVRVVYSNVNGGTTIGNAIVLFALRATRAS